VKERTKPPHGNEEGFHRWDGMAMEYEYQVLLQSLVLASKPELVIETGTGRGYTSAFIADALVENGFGKLITFEPDPKFAEEARANLAGMPVEVVNAPSSTYTGRDPDFLFLDSGPEYRKDEIERWLSRPGLLVAVHDANRAYPLGLGLRLVGGDGFWVGRT